MNDTQTPADHNGRLLAALSPHQVTHVYEAGSTLFRQNAEPGGVHILLSGQVDLVFSRNDPQRSLRYPTPGLILGLSSLIAGRTQEYDAIAATTVITGYIDKETLLGILHADPALWFAVLQVLSADIISCYDRVKQLTSSSREA